jgi:hypothetical protein
LRRVRVLPRPTLHRAGHPRYRSLSSVAQPPAPSASSAETNDSRVHEPNVEESAKQEVERKVRRLAAKKSKRTGFGWKREVRRGVRNVGSISGLPRGVLERESTPQMNGPITPMEDAFAVSRMREIRLSGSMWRGPETE